MEKLDLVEDDALSVLASLETTLQLLGDNISELSNKEQLEEVVISSSRCLERLSENLHDVIDKLPEAKPNRFKIPNS